MSQVEFNLGWMWETAVVQTQLYTSIVYLSTIQKNMSQRKDGYSQIKWVLVRIALHTSMPVFTSQSHQDEIQYSMSWGALHPDRR